MIKLYTTLINNTEIINDVETYFNTAIIMQENPFDSNTDKKIMKIIDGVTYKDGVIIKTKFGKTHIDKLSTGCKAVLLVNKFKGTDTIVNVTECGDNAIELIFKLGEKFDINLYTQRVLRLPNMKSKCKVNDKETLVGEELYRKLVDRVE